jgi:hypothetical protein
MLFIAWHATTPSASEIYRERGTTNAAFRNKPVFTLSFIQTPPPPERPDRKQPEFVAIHLILLRLKEQGTDILITINAPHYAGEYEKPAVEGEATLLMKDGDAIRERVLESFEVKDWGLFSPGEAEAEVEAAR